MLVDSSDTFSRSKTILSFPALLQNLLDRNRLNIGEAIVKGVLIWQIELSRRGPHAEDCKDILQLFFWQKWIHRGVRWELCDLESFQLFLTVVGNVELDT
jgi:hypothetical protein